LVVRALVRFTLPALERVCGRLNVRGFVFILVALHLFLDHLFPPLWQHLLVRHEGDGVGPNCAGLDLVQHKRITQVTKDGPQAIHIDLHEEGVVPFLDHFSGGRLFQCVVVNSFFQVAAFGSAIQDGDQSLPDPVTK